MKDNPQPHPSKPSIFDRPRSNPNPNPTPQGREGSDSDQPTEHACYSEFPVSVPMLDLVPADGGHIGLNYHYLEETRLTAEGNIQLGFAHHRVRITGRNLLPLYEGIQGHRVRRVRVPAHAEFADERSTETLIASIAVERIEK